MVLKGVYIYKYIERERARARERERKRERGSQFNYLSNTPIGGPKMNRSDTEPGFRLGDLSCKREGMRSLGYSYTTCDVDHHPNYCRD